MATIGMRVWYAYCGCLCGWLPECGSHKGASPSVCHNHLENVCVQRLSGGSGVPGGNLVEGHSVGPLSWEPFIGGMPNLGGCHLVVLSTSGTIHNVRQALGAAPECAMTA